MLSLVVALVVLLPDLPAECQAPPTREVSALTGFAQSSGSLSVGLDSVATWCFDSGGGWTGGQKPAKGSKKAASVEPTGDCAKAIISCEAARASMSAETRSVLFDALKDIERPFLGVKYKPKRSGLAERPPEVAECSSKDRSTLFSHAQARMDLARLASQVQNEYANYKTWLFSEGLKCGQAVARGEKDYLRRGIAIDTPTHSGGTQQVPAATVDPVATTGSGLSGGTTGVPGGTGNTGTTIPAGGTTGGGTTGSTAAKGGTTGTASTVAVGGTNGTGTSPALPERNPTAIGTTGGSSSVVGTSKPSGTGTNSTATGGTGTATSGNPIATATGGNATATGGSGTATGGNTTATGGNTTATGGTGTATGGNTTVAANGTGRPSTGTPATTGSPLSLGGPTAEREKALSSSLLEKWRYFLVEQTKIEGDGDWLAGFLSSRELRDCRCTVPRPVPGDVVRRLENKDRVAQLEADDEKNTRCELCLLDSYPKWKVRSQKQCTLALELTEFELGVLQRSDDGNGFPPRCAEAARAKQKGAPAAATATATVVKPTVAGAPLSPQPKANNAYIITRAPDAVTVPMGDFLKPDEYAPIPSREEGRVYVRVFTSSACVAEVLPGPVQARTGDLLPVPPSAKEITVRGPCGGFAEIYFGREEKPRVAESFARNQPLRLQFRQ